MKCLIKHMAVVAPIPAKNEDHARVTLVAFAYGLFDFGLGGGIFAIEIRIRLECRRHLKNIRMRHDRDTPFVTLLLPSLLLRYVAGSRTVRRCDLDRNRPPPHVEARLILFS